MDVSQVGRQHWQTSLDILARAVPAQQRLDCKSMTKVVQAGTVTGRGPAQTDPARQLVEGSMDITDVQVISSTGDEEGRGCGAACKEALPARSILREHLLGRPMDRYEAGFAELGTANRQQTFLKIDILDLESDRLTNPQAGDTEQAEQTVIRPRA